MREDDVIKKWLNNELTGAERAAFEASSDYALSSKIIETAHLFKAPHTPELESFQTFKSNSNLNRPAIEKPGWLQFAMRIAAVLVVALGVYFMFFNNTTITTQTLVAEKLTLDLPDKSQVILNALSKIDYDESNWDTHRRLNLEGEAYFKVAKGSTFDVVTKNGIVTVVGTEFNVKQRANYFEVNCFEGHVKVVSDTITRHLVAGDSYRILNTVFSEYKITASTPDWTDNKSVFTAVTFSEVLAELERQYAIEVTYKDINMNRLFTGGFTHIDLENALQSITKPMNLTYKLNASNLVEIYEVTE